jgi:hypothetical protein
MAPINTVMANFDNPPLRRRHRWWLAAAALAVLALVYAGYWFIMASSSRLAVVKWIDDQRGQGYSVRYDSLDVTGFPFAVRIEFINPGFGAPGAALPWGWEGANLKLMLKPWDMQSIRVMTTGPQVLAIPVAGKTEIFNGQATLIESTVVLSDGLGKSAALRLEGIELKAETATLAAIRIARGDVQVRRLVFTMADHQTASASLTASLHGLGGPWLAASPLGGNVQSLTLEARLMGSFDEGPLVQSLENWRDNGGTIEIGKLNFQHGPLKINADGTLALDGQLQPIGALTARVEGFFQTIDALKRLGAVTPRDAITAKMVLGVLSRKSKNGAPAHLNLALSAQGNKLYAGPIGLMEIPEIDWRPFRKD